MTPLTINNDFINFSPNHFVFLQKIKLVQCLTLKNDNDDKFVTSYTHFLFSFKLEKPIDQQLNGKDLPILKPKKKKSKQYPDKLFKKHAIN